MAACHQQLSEQFYPTCHLNSYLNKHSKNQKNRPVPFAGTGRFCVVQLSEFSGLKAACLSFSGLESPVNRS